MPVGLLGRKVGMTQIFDDAGEILPVTVIQAGPCHVLQLRTKDRDGYEAVQVGYLDRPRQRSSRSQRGHVARLDSKRSRALEQAGVEFSPKADCEPKQFVREFRGPVGGQEVGQELTVANLAEVKAVDITGVSKGRGYAGVMKRHGFAGQRASHGVKKVHRHLGSSGCNTSPSRTFKGKRMPGQFGAARRTVRNLRVVGVDEDRGLLLIKGAVPGANGGLLVIRATNKV